MSRTLRLALYCFLISLPLPAQTFEADNGARFRIAGVMVINPGSWQDRRRTVGIVNEDGYVSQVMFNCLGDYSVHLGPWLRIPPRSVLAQISRSACR